MRPEERLQQVLNRFSAEDATPAQMAWRLRYAAGLVLVFLFAFWIRMLPSMQYLQALDPYMIGRMAEAIVTEGHLPLLDVWRYFPYITPTYVLNLGDIYLPAWLYTVLGGVGMGFVEWTKTYPAFMGALMVVPLYFLGKELAGRRTGLLGAFFLATSAAVLHRSSMGWFEKEAQAGPFMLASLYFVLRAWKRTDWKSGILAGLSFGFATTIWGGTRYLALLFPAATFFALFLDEDTENLVAAFTPLMVLGHTVPSILNPSRWSVDGTFAMAGWGVLGLVWIRYLVEKHELVRDDYLPYVTPGATVAGFVAVLLSPLYSQRIAGTAMQIQNLVFGADNTGTAVIAQTIAESTAASFQQIASQLGAVGAATVLPQGVVIPAQLVGGIQLAVVGLYVMLVLVGLMLARKYIGVETVTVKTFYGSIIGLLALTTVLLFASGSGMAIVLFASTVLALLGGIILTVYPAEEEFTITYHWYYVLVFVWALTAIVGVKRMSRLMFIAAQPVSLIAGFALAKGLDRLEGSAVWAVIEAKGEGVTGRRVFAVVAAVILLPVVVINAASAVGMAGNVGGSPNPLWMENLDYMRGNTPVDSVVLSWWDYGYWFETIGGRAAIADGGNLAFYRHANESYEYNWKINMPLADFLTAEDYTDHLDWLESLSVDYVVLDSTMIGKYSAVSIIHNRGEGRPASMQTFGCQTSQQNRQQCQPRTVNGQDYLVYNARGSRFLLPVQQGSQGGYGVAGTPLLQSQRGTFAVENFCSTSGIVPFDPPENRSVLPGCVAFHPFRGSTQLIYIPEQAMESTLVRLYVMDAPDMPHFEEVFDNGYVKMWRVDYDAE